MAIELALVRIGTGDPNLFPFVDRRSGIRIDPTARRIANVELHRRQYWNEV